MAAIVCLYLQSGCGTPVCVLLLKGHERTFYGITCPRQSCPPYVFAGIAESYSLILLLCDLQFAQLEQE